MTTHRRNTVDLGETDVWKVLDALPIQAFSAEDFVPDYKKMDFKLAPDWSKAKPYVACIDTMFECSGGYCVNQASAFHHAQTWAAQNDLAKKFKISGELLERGIYRLRAIASQLANHLTKKRAVPLEHQRVWGCTLTKIRTVSQDIETHASGNDEGDEVFLVAAANEPSHVVNLISDDDCDDKHSKDQIERALQSTDPELQALLDASVEDTSFSSCTKLRRRIRSKTSTKTKKHDDMLVGAKNEEDIPEQGVLNLDELEALAKNPVEVTKKDWASLQKSLKEENLQKGKATDGKPKAKKMMKKRTKKNEQPKKRQAGQRREKKIKADANAMVPFWKYKKREHSKAWHQTYELHKDIDVQSAKKHASEAGRKINAKLYELAKAKQLPEWVELPSWAVNTT